MKGQQRIIIANKRLSVLAPVCQYDRLVETMTNFHEATISWCRIHLAKC